MILRLVFLCAILSCCLASFGQSSLIRCTKYKELHREDGKWEQWPSNWNHYESDAIFVVTELENNEYQIQMFVEDKLIAEVLATYDPEASALKRKDWDEKQVYCYKDRDSNYLFLRKISLESVVENPKLWKQSGASMYLWLFTEDYAVLLK